MIAFFIFYFVFSALFMVGVQWYNEDDISISDWIFCTLVGWLLMPFGLGMLFARINGGYLKININEDSVKSITEENYE